MADVHTFEYSGGVHRTVRKDARGIPTTGANYKFMAFLVDAGQEVPLTRAVQLGFAEKEGTDRYRTDIKYLKLFMQFHEMHREKKQFAFYLRLGDPLIRLTIQNFNGQPSMFKFEGKAKVLDKATVLNTVLPESIAAFDLSRRLFLHQRTPQIHELQRMVTVVREQPKTLFKERELL